MSYTNSTANYQLPQYVGTDIPSILTDVNNAYQKIDTVIHEVSVSAGQSSQDVSAVRSRVDNLESSVNGLSSTVSSVSGKVVVAVEDIDSLEADVTNIKNDVTSIQDVIPNSASTTNKLITVDEIPEIPEIDTLETEVAGIKEVIPTNASSSNKLATMADIGGGSSSISKWNDVTSATGVVQGTDTYQSAFKKIYDYANTNNIDFMNIAISIGGVTHYCENSDAAFYSSTSLSSGSSSSTPKITINVHRLYLDTTLNNNSFLNGQIAVSVSQIDSCSGSWFDNSSQTTGQIKVYQLS